MIMMSSSFFGSGFAHGRGRSLLAPMALRTGIGKEKVGDFCLQRDVNIGTGLGQHELRFAEPLDIQKGRQVAMIDAGICLFF